MAAGQSVGGIRPASIGAITSTGICHDDGKSPLLEGNRLFSAGQRGPAVCALATVVGGGQDCKDYRGEVRWARSEVWAR